MNAKTEVYERTIRIAAHTGTLVSMPFGCTFIDPDVKYILNAKYENNDEARVDHCINVEPERIVIDLYNSQNKTITVRLVFYVSGEFLDISPYDVDDTIETFKVDDIDDDEYDLEFEEPAVKNIKSKCKLAENIFRAMLKK